MEIKIRYENFDDLFRHICVEIEKLENVGMEPEGEGDPEYNQWMKDSITDETKELMVRGSLSGLDPATYAQVAEDSFTYCQAHPNSSFGSVFLQRLEQRAQIEGMMRLKELA